MARLSILVLVLALSLGGLASATSPLPSTFRPLSPDEQTSIPPFSFTDQNGQTISREDLRGKVWVAFFFYAGCAEGCADNTRRVAELTRRFSGWPNLVFVGFNLNSSQEGVAELRRYAEAFDAEQSRWHLLTGPEDAIHKLVKEGFWQGLQATPERGPGKQFIHSFALVLVDPRGKMRGFTSETEASVKSQYLDHVITPISHLVQAQYFPSINAGLNALAGVWLVLGWLAIQRRWITCHKVCMLVALGTSAVFLGCYLYYHFVLTDGSPTRFGGTGAVWWLYIAILLSHTILAAAVAPLALVTAYLGIRDRLKSHVWLARWTFPLWLYVSVTGVVVYWMLYHLYPPA